MGPHMKRKLLIIPAIVISLVGLGALNAIPAAADTPTPTPTPAPPGDAFECQVGSTGLFTIAGDGYYDPWGGDASGYTDSYPGANSYQRFGETSGTVNVTIPLARAVWVNNTTGWVWASLLSDGGVAARVTLEQDDGAVAAEWTHEFPGYWSPDIYRQGMASGATWFRVTNVHLQIYANHLWYGGVGVNGLCEPAVTPTPTPRPTTTEVPFVHVSEPCITATVAAPLATPTLYSLTPQPTPTPGGPTATPNVVAAAPIEASFDTGLFPFVSISDNVRRIAGPSAKTGDLPGVAFLPWNTFGDMDMNKDLIYIPPQTISGHYRLKGYARTENIPSGDQAFVRVWGLRVGDFAKVRLSTDGDGNQITTDWSFWSVEVTDPAEYIQLEVDVYIFGTGSGWVNDSLADYPGARLDDVTLAIGDDQVNQSYPVCSPAGGGAAATKFCPIALKPLDVFVSRCGVQPESLLDIGGYFAWLGCRINTYWTILPENQGQLDTIVTSANHTEPFGSLLESKTVLEYVGGRISDYQARYTNYRQNTVDWSIFFNWQGLMHLHLPDPSTLHEDMAMYVCQLGDIQDLPESVKRPACMVENLVTNSGLAAPLQLLIDLFLPVGLILYVRANWMAGGGGEVDE
jgi:hypothetical protein